VVLAAVSVPATMACNAILGLDDFERTECGPHPCNEGGADVVAPDTFVPDARVEAGTDAPPGVAPAVWAEFEMPNHAPDAGILAADPHPLAYTVNDDNIVTDAVTGLVWRRGVIGGGLGTEYEFADARSECQKLDPASGPWRLPK